VLAEGLFASLATKDNRGQMRASRGLEAREYVMPDTHFRVKGVVFSATRPYFDAQIECGYEGLLAVLPPQLREFMSQPFVTGALYEIMHLPDLIEYEALAAKTDPDLYLRSRAQWQARRDLGGIYKLIARAAPAAIVVRRSMVLLPQILNFGSAAICSESPRHVAVEISGVPLPLVGWLERVVVIYAQTVIDYAKVDDGNVVSLQRTTGPTVHGFPTQSLNFEARWGGVRRAE
jgi:hypothetical protein